MEHEVAAQGRCIHDWGYITFSDKRMVSALIRNRAKFATAYSGSSSTVYTGVSEQITCAYIDLDKLIKETELTKNQREVIRMMMLGWSVKDIAEKAGCDYATIDTHFRRAVRKIVENNNRKYSEFNKLS